MRMSWGAVVVWGLLASGAGLRAQAVPSLENIHNQQELDRAITMLDTQLFDAYNTCNLEKFSSFFVDDVEF